jgi:membrane protease subunit HflC
MKKRNPLTITIGAVLLVVFIALLFCYQVRKSEVAVVTTFGKPTGKPETELGLHFKWPWPIQKVHKLDQRIQNFDGKFEETLTSDGFNLMVMTYVGWRIHDPAAFFPKFTRGDGDTEVTIREAERILEEVVRSAKNEVVGQHPFSDFISTDETKLKFGAIENEILDKVQQRVAANSYGMEIKFLGVKKLGLPESVTQNVFQRMQSERQVLISKIENEGKEEASKIRSSAQRESAKLLADAEADATRIRGLGEAEAAKSFAVFQKNPDLANLILKLNALEMTLKEKATLVVDPTTPPFDLLKADIGMGRSQEKK